MTVFAVRFFRWQTPDEQSLVDAIVSSAQFSFALMAILVAHEMGHFLAARRHYFRISLPWFLPFPFLIGTLGAIIRFKDRPTNRNALLEMAAAGPLCGLTVIGLVIGYWSYAGGALESGEGTLRLGTPVLFSLIHFMRHGEWMVVISAYDPLAFAAWIGCLVTALNLLPFGQLDGGHIFYALFPQQASKMGWCVTAILVLGGYFWIGWLLWGVALHLIGSRHPVDLRRNDGFVSMRAKGFAVLCLFAGLMCFTPVPIQIVF